MSYRFHAKQKTSRVRTLFVAALVLGCAAGAHAQSLTSPPTPAILTPPAGNTAFLLGQAIGTQGYICLPTPPSRRRHRGRSRALVRKPRSSSASSGTIFRSSRTS